MKFLSVIALLALSLNSFASSKLATCTTIGDALDSVELVAGKDGSITKVKVNSMDPSRSKSYTVNKELSSLNSRSSLRIIAAQNPRAVYGGAIFNAIKLDLDSRMTSGVLAADGAVFLLNCQR